MFRSLGQLSAFNGSLRSQIDRITARATYEAHSGGLTAARVAGLPLAELETPLNSRAERLDERIATLMESDRQPASDRRAASSRRPSPDRQPLAAMQREASPGNGEDSLAEESDPGHRFANAHIEGSLRSSLWD